MAPNDILIGASPILNLQHKICSAFINCHSFRFQKKLNRIKDAKELSLWTKQLIENCNLQVNIRLLEAAKSS